MEFPFDRRQDVIRMVKVTALVMAGTFILFSYLWRNIRLSNLKYDIVHLKKERKELYLKAEKLRLQAARQSTASRMDELFKQKYGYLPVNIRSRITTIKYAKKVISQ